MWCGWVRVIVNDYVLCFKRFILNNKSKIFVGIVKVNVPAKFNGSFLLFLVNLHMVTIK